MTESILASGPAIITKKNVVMDATVMSSLMACPRLTEFRYVHNLVPITGKGNALEVGSLMHKMLEIYYKTIRDGFSKDLALGNALTAGQEYIKTGDDGNGLLNTPPDNVKHKNGQLKDIGWRYAMSTIEQYCEFYKGDSWIPLEVEKVMGEVIYEDNEIRLLWKAKLDLTVDTNQGIYPVDHKTMKQKRDTLNLSNQFMGQCILNKSRNVIINKIGFQSTLEPEEKFTRHVMSYSADRLAEWMELAAYYAKYLVQLQEAKYYPPNFSYCDKYFGCIFKDICMADRNMRNEELSKRFMVGEAWEISDED